MGECNYSYNRGRSKRVDWSGRQIQVYRRKTKWQSTAKRRRCKRGEMRAIICKLTRAGFIAPLMIQSLLLASKRQKGSRVLLYNWSDWKYIHILSVRMQMAWNEPYVSDLLDLSCIDPGDVSAKDKGNEEKWVFSGFKTMESHWMVWSGQWAAKVVSGQHIIESGILGYNSNSLWRDLPYYRNCIWEPFRLKFPVQRCWNLRELSNIQTSAIKGELHKNME